MVSMTNNTDPDTTPLPRDIGETNELHDIETNDLREHYIIHANGFYGDHQYADLSLILRGNHING